MITERTLRNWRRDALRNRHTPKEPPLTAAPGEELNVDLLYQNELNSRILRLTQELLDLYLMRKERP